MDRPSATPRSARGYEPGGDGGRRGGQRGRRRARVSELALGVVVVAVCALGVVLLAALDDEHGGRARAGPVGARRGGAGGRRPAGRPTSTSAPLVGHLAATDAARVIGQSATADLPAGTLVTAALFAGRPPVPAGSTVVAAALVPGQFATFQLRPGQTVTAIRTGGATAGAEPDAGTVLAPATVYEVRPLDDTAGTWIVSLLVPEAAAPARGVGGGGQGAVAGARGGVAMSERSELGDTVGCSPRSGERLTGAPRRAASRARAHDRSGHQ